MNNRIFGLIVAISILATSSVFAEKGWNRNSAGERRHNVVRNKQVLGTVKSLESETATFIVTNSDGEDIKIAVNPRTRIWEIPENFPSPHYYKKKPRNLDKKISQDKIQPPPQLSLSEISPGDWVEITIYDGETKTKEARHIQVSKKK